MPVPTPEQAATFLFENLRLLHGDTKWEHHAREMGKYIAEQCDNPEEAMRDHERLIEQYRAKRFGVLVA